jgi:hypothetical protein
MQHFIQASTTSGQTSGRGTKADDFQQGSTFVKMMLDKKGKTSAALLQNFVIILT